jgi:opacity protein-like surface antigen
VDTVHNYDMRTTSTYSEGYFNYDYFGNYFNDLLNFKNGVTPSGSGAGSKGCNSSGYENQSSGTVTGLIPATISSLRDLEIQCLCDFAKWTTGSVRPG